MHTVTFRDKSKLGIEMGFYTPMADRPHAGFRGTSELRNVYGAGIEAT